MIIIYSYFGSYTTLEIRCVHYAVHTKTKSYGNKKIGLLDFVKIVQKRVGTQE